MTVARELDRLQLKSQSIGLEAREHVSLKTLLSSLREIDATERELEAATDLADVSDLELREKVRDIL